MVELEVKPSVKLEDGMYEGKITGIEFRTSPFNYTDIFIEEKKTKMQLKYGAPTYISEKSKLGKLLAQFTALKVGEKLDPEKVLIGKDIKFMTLMEKTDQGEFVRIVDNSIKPL